MQMRGGGTSQPLYKGGRAGRPAAGRLGPAAPLLGDWPQGPARKYFYKSFCTKAPAAPQRGDQVPAARQRGDRGIFLYISKSKIYFIKNENKKYKNKKPLPRLPSLHGRVWAATSSQLVWAVGPKFELRTCWPNIR